MSDNQWLSQHKENQTLLVAGNGNQRPIAIGGSIFLSDKHDKTAQDDE